MSMPMHLNVVVVGKSSEIAGIVAAVLRGKNIGGINPQIIAASTSIFYKNGMFPKNSSIRGFFGLWGAWKFIAF